MLVPLGWYPMNTHYIRCYWGWLLRVPSQGYHHFPFDCWGWKKQHHPGTITEYHLPSHYYHDIIGLNSFSASPKISLWNIVVPSRCSSNDRKITWNKSCRYMYDYCHPQVHKRILYNSSNDNQEKYYIFSGRSQPKHLIAGILSHTQTILL